jgi:hypothetical protein
MQSLAFLCFELQMTQRYLSDITFGSAQPRANSANLNTPIGAGTLASVKKKRSKVLLRIVARIAILPLFSTPDPRKLRTLHRTRRQTPLPPVQVYPEKGGVGQTGAEETVSVIHPKKSQAATFQLPRQLSAYTDAPIYAQTSGYLKSSSFDIGEKAKANDILGRSTPRKSIKRSLR